MLSVNFTIPENNIIVFVSSLSSPPWPSHQRSVLVVLPINPPTVLPLKLLLKEKFPLSKLYTLSTCNSPCSFLSPNPW